MMVSEQTLGVDFPSTEAQCYQCIFTHINGDVYRWSNIWYKYGL